jgi:hypothetical protein
MTASRVAVLAVILWAFPAVPASAAVVYRTLDNPLAGSGGTMPFAVDGSRVVGQYFDPAGRTHGFIYDGATWATVDAPDAFYDSAVRGVSGQRVSGDYTPRGPMHGYVYDGTTFSTFVHPATTGTSGLPQATFTRGIDGTTVVGSIVDSRGTHGFIYDGATFTDIDYPGAGTTNPADVDAGRIVGSYENGGARGFIYENGTWRTLSYPAPAFATVLTGIDGPNVVGVYQGPPNGDRHGFLYDGVDFTPIDYPGAPQTTVMGIDGNTVVGYYYDASGFTHGFIGTVPEPASGAAASFAWAYLLARPRRRSARGT